MAVRKANERLLNSLFGTLCISIQPPSLANPPDSCIQPGYQGTDWRQEQMDPGDEGYDQRRKPPRQVDSEVRCWVS